MLQLTDKGLYCTSGNFYIDPWKPVDNALITHAHSDHAHGGNKNYLAHPITTAIIKHRLGDFNTQNIEYNQPIYINGIKVSFHPAGHIVGSAQIRLEHKGEIWVVSGDYKLENDGVATPFEPIKCHTFITECTFGLPIYRWQNQQVIYSEINEWWKENQNKGKTSVLLGYVLGKAQRILQNIDHGIGKIFLHGAIYNLHHVLRDTCDIELYPAEYAIAEHKKNFPGSLIIAPPGAMNTTWIRKFNPYSTGVASGWMQLRGTRKRKAVDRGFVLSDHPDWDGLLKTVKETGAEKIFATHGYTSVFSKYLRENGYDAEELRTFWEGESLQENVQEIENQEKE